MKPNFLKYKSPEAEDIAIKLNRILSNINLDNLRYRYITGTTDAVANTERLFAHGMTPRPWIVLPITGDVYIQNLDNTNVDIRSTQTSITFTAIALG